MKLSILDYVPLFEGDTPQEALNHSIELAQLSEKLGYARYWVAEHHQVPSVVSSAPEIVMAMLLEHTHSIHIGSGGVMLPHYSAYKVAEQFKIMEVKHPGRIDMGIGRSPSFKNVNEALNEFKTQKPELSQQVDDLDKYFTNDTIHSHRFKTLEATPYTEHSPEMFILGMSEQSAELAAKKGLPFVIAHMGQSHANLTHVIRHYKSRFTEYHGHSHSPYIILATFVVTAENELTIKQLLDALNVWLIRINYLKQPKVYPSIETAQQRHYSERDREKIEKNKRRIISGLPHEVAQQLIQLQNEFEVDEIMILPNVYGHTHRTKLIELIAQACLDN